MFSAVIPLYNKASYIKKAIDSVLNQTFQDFELIIVNDGSTDNGLSVVEQFSDKRITVFNQINSGVSVARNSGVLYAKFEQIAFLDADDWWEDNFLEEMSNLIGQYSQAVLYGSSYYLAYKNIRKLTAISQDNTIKEGYIDYIDLYQKYKCMPFFPSSVIIRKNIFIELGGFKKELKVGEDFDLWIRVALSNNIVFINKPLSNYNQELDANARGVSRKFHNIESYFSFNLEYLEPFEKQNQTLKNLIDYLKVVSLEHYYFNTKFHEEVKLIIKNIELKNIPTKIALSYQLPFLLGKFRYNFYKIAVIIKKQIIK